MYQTTTHHVSPLSLGEIAQAINSALRANYTTAIASVAECPHLREAPYHIAVSGLSGDECIADIGGQSQLFPRPLLDEKYSMLECANAMNMSPKGGALLGAGAAPYLVVGTNAGFAPNLTWETEFENVENATRVMKVTGEGSVVCETLDSTECALVMNLFGSTGSTGPVLRVTSARLERQPEELHRVHMHCLARRVW